MALLANLLNVGKTSGWVFQQTRHNLGNNLCHVSSKQEAVTVEVLHVRLIPTDVVVRVCKETAGITARFKD